MYRSLVLILIVLLQASCGAEQAPVESAPRVKKGSDLTGVPAAAKQRFVATALRGLADWIAMDQSESDDGSQILMPAYSYRDQKIARRVLPAVDARFNVSLLFVAAWAGLEGAGKSRGPLTALLEGRGLTSFYDQEEAAMERFIIENRRAMIENSKRLFGRSLIRKEERLSAHEVLNHYDPEVVEHACSAMFLSPDESTGGYALQRIYDEVLREAVWRHALILKLLLHDRSALARDTAQFIRALQQSPGRLDQYRYFDDLEMEQYPYDEYYFLQIPPDPHRDSMNNALRKIKAFLMRREYDGSLPAILSCAEKYMKAYDFELYENYVMRPENRPRP